MTTYTAEIKSPHNIWLHTETGFAGIIEHRATGWVARPYQAGRRASTKRWNTPEAAARSMWGRGAVEAIETAWREALMPKLRALAKDTGR